MKKTGKKSKLMVGLVVGVATMICGFVAYAATGIVKTDNKYNCYSTDKGNEQQAFSVQNPYYKVVYCKKK